MRLDLENGKYTYVLNDDEPSSQYVLRYGAPWRDLTGDKFIYCMAAKIEEQAERIKELEKLIASYRTAWSCGELEQKQAEQIKELEEYGKAGWATADRYMADYHAQSEKVEKQSAALKLASLALSEGVEYVEEPPEKNCTCHLAPPCNDCVEHSAVREFFIDARKAPAAIDEELKGE